MFLLWDVGYKELTAGRAATSVTGLEGLLGAPLSKIIGASVDDNSALAEVSNRIPTIWGSADYVRQ